MCQPLLLEDIGKDLDRGEFEEAKVKETNTQRGISVEDSIMEFTPKAVVTKVSKEDTASPLRPPTKTSQHFQGPPSPPQTISRSSKSVSQNICCSSDAVMEHLEDSTAQSGRSAYDWILVFKLLS